LIYFEIKRFFVKRKSIEFMLYSLELQMAGVILLTAMAAGGLSLWVKRRKAQKELDEAQNNDTQTY
jgi:hypothetical protein